jgi:tripartite-type tricarboxylate transporter receptor subunit TctC
MQTFRLTGQIFVLSVFAAALAPCMSSASAEDFYAGKAIDFIIGASPGGGFDTYARAIARHLPRYIPGQPNIIPKNMPGAGSAKSISFVYSAAAKDGTVMGAAFPGAIMEPLLGNRAKAPYDPPKLQFIGTADNGTRVCATWHTSKTKTFEDAMQRKTILGATQSGGSSRDYAYMHNKLNGTKFEIVSGYKGAVDIWLAVERGEVEGTCGFEWSSLRNQHPDWLREKKLNILVQVALEPEPGLTQMGVPRITKFIKNAEDKKALDLIITQQVFGRPYFMPPGTPPQRVNIMRNAFSKTMVDREFLAEAKKLRIDIEPLDGDKVQKLVEDLFKTPADVVERAKAALRP